MLHLTYARRGKICAGFSPAHLIKIVHYLKEAAFLSTVHCAVRDATDTRKAYLLPLDLVMSLIDSCSAGGAAPVVVPGIVSFHPVPIHACIESLNRIISAGGLLAAREHAQCLCYPIGIRQRDGQAVCSSMIDRLINR